MKKIILLLLIFALFPVSVQVHAAEIMGVGVVTTAVGPLNVRNGPTTGSAVVGALQKGSYVMLLGKIDGWYQVQYGKNAIGYASASYLTAVEGRAATVTASALNVRKGGGTGYAVQDYLHKSDPVVELSAANGWSKVVYHGTKTGYVSTKYLSGNAGVSMAVPKYLQHDSRWGHVTLGTSGKAMAKIGCATTAIAMMESYRTGSTIYPDAMARRLQYTTGGSVYWPANYKVTTTFQMSAVRNILDSGKPVLFGARNASGTQHWVVITGYTGDGTSAADFLINDPGTTARMDLSRFLTAYPTFYKYFHY